MTRLKYDYSRSLHWCANGWGQDVYVQREGEEAWHFICDECEQYPAWWDREGEEWDDQGN